MNDTKLSIGDRLTQKRQSRGLLQVDVARNLGVSVSAVKMYEKDVRTPSHKIMLGYSKLFDCTLDELFA